MTLKTAKTFFPEPLSPCCTAPVFHATCQKCGKVVPMAFFIVSNALLDDETLIGIEARIRANPELPVGIEMVLLANPKNPDL